MPLTFTFHPFSAPSAARCTSEGPDVVRSDPDRSTCEGRATCDLKDPLLNTLMGLGCVGVGVTAEERDEMEGLDAAGAAAGGADGAGGGGGVSPSRATELRFRFEMRRYGVCGRGRGRGKDERHRAVKA